MFKKAATYKPSAAIRNSERKALIADVKQHFAAAFDGQTDEDVKDIIDLLLPSAGIEATSFTSTKGHRGILYTHATVPIFIRYEDKLVPTLHTLWKYPALTTSALTGSQVLPNLQAGSDLMVKGMFEYSTAVKKGDVVGILVSDKSQYVAVGIAAIDFDSVDREAGGKGILLVSCLGDTITPAAAYPAEAATVIDSVTQDIQSTSLDDDEGKVLSTEQTRSREPELTTEEIDESFIQALLYGLHTLSSQAKDVALPMAASTMIDSYVLPYLPSHHPDLVLKRTSWKKANKFLSKQKMLKTKETKGQLAITSIDWSAADLTNFTPYELPAASPVPATDDKTQTAAIDNESPTITIDELYTLPSRFDPLLTNDSSHGPYFSRQEISSLLDSYYTRENLVSPATKKLIIVDANLHHLLLSSSSSNAGKKEISRDVLLRTLIKNAHPHYRINGGKIKKGNVPDMHIIIESRQGRKSVTRLLHLETYFDASQIDRIVDELKRKCAVSVSVGEVKGTKPGTSVELNIQGKKSGEAQQVLEKWGLNKSMIQVTDKTK